MPVVIKVMIVTEIKGTLIQKAKDDGLSLSTFVTVTLLKRYKPMSWQTLVKDALARTEPNNGVRPGLINDGEPEPLFFSVPPALKAKIQEEACKNYRSISAEIRKCLVEEYGK